MAIEVLVRSSVAAFVLATAAPGQREASQTEPASSASTGSLQSAECPAETIEAILQRARPTAREDAWRRIPWRTSLTAALAEAARDRKPVYAFLSDGWFPTGNC